jgi:hypothetical protein
MGAVTSDRGAGLYSVEAGQDALEAEVRAADDEANASDGGEVSSPGSNAEELKGEAGEPVGEMPPAAVSSSGLPPDEMRVNGSAQLTDFKVFGKKPTTSSFVLTGGKTLVDGAFKKGETVRVEGLALVCGEGADDTLDSETKQAVSCERKQRARFLDLKVSPAKTPAVLSLSDRDLELLQRDGSVEVDGHLLSVDVVDA